MERLLESLTVRSEPLIEIHQAIRPRRLHKFLTRNRHRSGSTVRLSNTHYSISKLIKYTKIIQQYVQVDTFIVYLYINDSRVVDLRHISVRRLELNAFIVDYELNGCVLIDSSRIESLKVSGMVNPQLGCPGGRDSILRELIMTSLHHTVTFDEETCRSIRWLQTTDVLDDTSMFTGLRHHRMVFSGPVNPWDRVVDTINSQAQVVVLERIHRRHIVLKGDTEEVVIEDGIDSVVEILGSPKKVIMFSCLNVNVITTAKIFDLRDAGRSRGQNRRRETRSTTSRESLD